MYKILIVDDDKAMRYMMKRNRIWEEYGFSIKEEACDGKEALSKLSSSDYDLIITDIRMPGMDGLEFLSELRAIEKNYCVMLLSTYTDFEYAKQGLRLGAFDFMTKPLTDELLHEALGRAKKHLDEKNESIKEAGKVKKEIGFYYPKHYEDTLYELLLSGSSLIFEYSGKVFSEVRELLGGDLQRMTLLLENMIIKICGKVFEAFPWMKQIEGESIMTALSGVGTESSLKMQFEGFIHKIHAIFDKYELYHADSIIKKTCEFIMNHIEENITLERIANEVHISKDYIGKLFKQKTSTNFSSYVTRVKMEYAKSLISDRGLKNYEVSEILGYSKPDYFSRLFKDYTGQTPTEYRKCNLK